MPTMNPTCRPSRQPTSQPSTRPSCKPSRQPSTQPSDQPSEQPVARPSQLPSQQPSNQPSRRPSMRPSRQPSQQPSAQPSKQPTQQPSAQPVMQPSAQPLSFPTQQPTSQPSRQPSRRPSMQPTRIPSRQPSAQPTNQPSRQPNNQPTNQPTHQPSQRPTNRPSKQPTMVLTTAYLCISSHILIIIHCNVTSCPFITTTSNQVHSLSCGLPANLPNNHRNSRQISPQVNLPVNLHIAPQCNLLTVLATVHRNNQSLVHLDSRLTNHHDCLLPIRLGNPSLALYIPPNKCSYLPSSFVLSPCNFLGNQLGCPRRYQHVNQRDNQAVVRHISLQPNHQNNPRHSPQDSRVASPYQHHRASQHSNLRPSPVGNRLRNLPDSQCLNHRANRRCNLPVTFFDMF